MGMESLGIAPKTLPCQGNVILFHYDPETSLTFTLQQPKPPPGDYPELPGIKPGVLFKLRL